MPHRGWECLTVEDLGAPDEICEMCETQEIRYVHVMSHPRFEGELRCGCVCAGKMEESYSAARERESRLRNAAARRSRWLRRQWRTSRQGNPYLNTDGMNVTVFRGQNDLWRIRIVDRADDETQFSRRRYRSEDRAKLAAFDAMIFLKSRGWGGGAS